MTNSCSNFKTTRSICRSRCGTGRPIDDQHLQRARPTGFHHNPKGETRTLTYDSNGYVIAADGPLPGTNDAIAFSYDTAGRVRTVTGTDGYTVTYSYDNLDRMTNIAYPDGTFAAFTYDKLDVVKTRDRLGRERCTPGTPCGN